MREAIQYYHIYLEKPQIATSFADSTSNMNLDIAQLLEDESELCAHRTQSGRFRLLIQYRGSYWCLAVQYG
jgi:hypothetical protein